MKLLPLAAALFCFATSAVHAEEAVLFRMTSATGPDANGTTPAMVFQEVTRNDTSSSVEAEAGTVSATTGSMFLMRGACALMKERKKHAFNIEYLSKRPIRFNVHFAEAAPTAAGVGSAPRAKTISSAQCERVESLFTK